MTMKPKKFKEIKEENKEIKEEKAEGIIRIFNDYSTASQSLVAGTRFVSDEGKLFRLVEKVVVPGQSTEKGKLIPGSVDVLVRADTAGSDYNIGVSTFSIPGFAGTPRYTAFYAKSFLAMAGGFKGESLAVSSEDLENAKKSLTAEVKEKIESNERFEFLGDSILSFIVSEYLFKNYPYNEGILTNLRSLLVNTKSLAETAAGLEFGKLLRLSKGEEESMGRQNQSLLADCFEAFIGALFLDQGVEVVKSFLCSKKFLIISVKFYFYNLSSEKISRSHHKIRNETLQDKA